MTIITPADFVKKWAIRFADNTIQNIREKDFREFTQDIADVFGITVAQVPEYKPGTTYQAGNLVRYTPPGLPEAFYYALNAGALSAPGPGNVTDWKVVPGPVKATDLWQPLTLVQAQGLDGAGVQAGRKYQIAMGLNQAGKPQYVYLDGLDQFFDTTRGVLEVDGTRTAIKDIDLGAGTWQPEGGLSLTTIDLLDLTPAQMDEVMALPYTDCDAAPGLVTDTPPGASPAWSYPGQQFDARDSQGRNCHFYCTRGTYDPTAAAGTTGVGPAWHYTVKVA